VARRQDEGELEADYEEELEAYCLDCTAPVLRVTWESKVTWPGWFLPGSVGWGGAGAVGTGGAVIPGEGVAGLVPSDCGEACEITIVNTGLGYAEALAVTGGVAFVTNPSSGGVLLAYDLSCSAPCAPAWIWEADSMRHGVQTPVFDGTSMFFVDADRQADAYTLRAFQVGATPQPGVPSTWAADRNGVVEHPGEDGIVAMSGAQRIPGTWELDLDTGQIVTPPGSADLWLEEVDETERVLVDATEVGQVKLAYLGQVDFESISPDDFGSYTWTDDPIRGTDDERNQLVPGAVFLVMTTEGNYSKVQVLPDDGYDMWLRWVTYEGG